MARVFAQNVSEMAIRATYSGRPVVTVLHFVNDEGALSDEAKARDILNNWQDHILDMLHSQYVLTGADWRSLDPDDTNLGTLAPDSAKPVAGLQGGAGATPNVAFLIRKVTNNRGRGQRDGRMFLAGVGEIHANEAGTLPTTTINEWQTALDAFSSGVNDDQFGVGGGSGLVVLNTTPASRAKGTQEVTVTYRTVAELVIDPKVATQRDRLR